MRRWDESVFVFISTNQNEEPDGVEARWIPVMEALALKGATVRFLCLMGSPAGVVAREAGIAVDPYILDKWNVIRSHSRLRKYLKRYMPVCAHSTGLEADLLLRWAARKVPGVEVAHTLTGDPQRTRRMRPVDVMMHRFGEFGMRSAAGIFVGSKELGDEARAVGITAGRVIVDPRDRVEASVARHLDFYRGLMAQRGTG